jgi:hypothetical protein
MRKWWRALPCLLEYPNVATFTRTKQETRKQDFCFFRLRNKGSSLHIHEECLRLKLTRRGLSLIFHYAAKSDKIPLIKKLDKHRWLTQQKIKQNKVTYLHRTRSTSQTYAPSFRIGQSKTDASANMHRSVLWAIWKTGARRVKWDGGSSLEGIRSCVTCPSDKTATVTDLRES